MKLLRLCALAFLVGVCAGSDVTFQWDKAPATATGYGVYWGTASRQYTNKWTISETSVTIPGLDEATKYYFATTAYDDIGRESDYSNEVFWHGTNWVGPQPPEILSVSQSRPLVKVHVRDYALFTGTNAALHFASNVSFDLYFPASNAKTIYSLWPIGGTNGHPPIVARLVE